MTERQRSLAVWSVFVIPFVVITVSLALRGELDARFVAAYWFTPAVLTAIGAIPAPWTLLSETT